MNPEEAEPIPFHRPSMTDAEINAAVEVLKSGWLTTGAKAHEFEAEFANKLGVRHALAVNSATAALHLALEAMGVREGDEVVIPTYTFTACGEVCAYLGARPVLADVDESGLIDAQSVARLVTARTKVVMPVHLGGQAVNPSPLRAAIPESVRLLEDAAHALPADVDGIRTGSLGDAAAFSFYATKTITTGGEGGVLATDDDWIAERAARMRLHGINADAWNRHGAGGKWFYEVEEAGFKYNLTDLAAAIGLAQLRRLDEMAAARTAIAAAYDAAFADCDLLVPPPRRPGDRHSWHLYAIRLNLENLHSDRAELVRRLSGFGIGTSVYFIPLHLHPWYQRSFGYQSGDFPVAEHLYERSISLPTWPDMTRVQVTRVSRVILDVLNEARRPVEV